MIPSFIASDQNSLLALQHIPKPQCQQSPRDCDLQLSLLGHPPAPSLCSPLHMSQVKGWSWGLVCAEPALVGPGLKPEEGHKKTEFWIHEMGQTKDEICLEQAVVQSR